VSGEEYVSGIDIRRIENKEFKRYDTNRARKIVIALDHSNVPFFARFTDKQISLIFDKAYTDSVDEIVAKAMSGDYEELLREVKRKKNTEGYLILLPEIADILHTTVDTLKSRPDDVQLALCHAYVNYWLCDTATIQRELARIMTVNNRTEEDLEKSREKEREVAYARARNREEIR
jgi:hypothetical protein